MLDEFHFIRPLWLWGLVLIPLLCLLLWRTKQGLRQWQNFVERDLLSYLIQGRTQRMSAQPLIWLGLGWLIAIVAMAGPSWQKLAQPQYVNQQPLVLLVDLSPSMAVTDIKPSRLVKMRFKLIDLLKSRQEGLTALVVYAGDAHVLAPLSEDRETLISLIPTLSPDIMPVQGSNTEEAIALAISLLQAQGYTDANIILFTDGLTQQAAFNVMTLLKQTKITLSVLGVGTKTGAPIPLSNQHFAKDKSGNIVLARLDVEPLKKIAAVNSGVYQNMSLDNTDIDRLLAVVGRKSANYQKMTDESLQTDQWEDAGQWLLWLLLPLTLLSFRRGQLLQFGAVSLLLMSFFNPRVAMAFEWQNLWESNNQQGAKALQAQQYSKAAAKFDDGQWRGVAQYKEQNYLEAAASFELQQSADGYYNQGNALAHLGNLAQAIEAYNKALLIEPSMKDAESNKVLVEKLLAAQQKQAADNRQQGSSADDQNNPESSEKNSAEQDNSGGQEPSADGEPSADEEPSADGKPTADAKPSADGEPSADKQRSTDNQSPAGDSSSGNTAEETLTILKEEQQLKQQQAIKDLSAQEQQRGGEQEAVEGNTIQSSQALQAQQLENWLGQLPEDASRLVRNKFNYEYQKKRQAYLNGQWQPPKEQRW